MKISENTIDPIKQEEGGWVGEEFGTPIPEMGNLCLKVRGSGNRSWRKLTRTLIDAVPRKKKVGGRLDEAEQDRINSICLRDACLLDWKNMEGDDGKPLPFSKELCQKYLTDPRYGKFRDACFWAASVVAEVEGADTEEDAGN